MKAKSDQKMGATAGRSARINWKDWREAEGEEAGKVAVCFSRQRRLYFMSKLVAAAADERS